MEKPIKYSVMTDVRRLIQTFFISFLSQRPLNNVNQVKPHIYDQFDENMLSFESIIE